MDDSAVPKTADEVDRLISAELPRLPENPQDPDYPRIRQLRGLVQHHMLHDCSSRNFTCWKRNASECKYGYPFYPTPHTTFPPEGGILYRRRRPCDSRVVSFNPLLLRKWKGHLNITLCDSQSVIFYLFKYIFKGPDKAHIGMRHASDADMSTTPGPQHSIDTATGFVNSALGTLNPRPTSKKHPSKSSPPNAND